MDAGGKTVALLVAAGTGSRAGQEAPKQYRAVAGRPLLSHAVERLRHAGIDEIQVVIGEGMGKQRPAAQQPVLLGSFAAGPAAAAGRNHQGRRLRRKLHRGGW